MKDIKEQELSKEVFTYEGKTHRHLLRQQTVFSCNHIGNDGHWTNPKREGFMVEDKVYLDREIPKRPIPYLNSKDGKILLMGYRPYVPIIIPLGKEKIFALIDSWKRPQPPKPKEIILSQLIDTLTDKPKSSLEELLNTE